MGPVKNTASAAMNDANASRLRSAIDFAKARSVSVTWRVRSAWDAGVETGAVVQPLAPARTATAASVRRAGVDNGMATPDP